MKINKVKLNNFIDNNNETWDIKQICFHFWNMLSVVSDYWHWGGYCIALGTSWVMKIESQTHEYSLKPHNKSHWEHKYNFFLHDIGPCVFNAARCIWPLLTDVMVDPTLSVAFTTLRVGPTITDLLNSGQITLPYPITLGISISIQVPWNII